VLTAAQVEALRDAAGQLLDPVTDFLIEDIAKRVAEAGQLTGTAAYQTWQIQKLGVSQKQLKKELQKKLKVSEKELEKLLKQAAKTGYNFDLSRLPTTRGIPFAANSSLQQIINLAVQQANKDLTNITRTMGFIGSDGKARTLTKAYKKACDDAFMRTVTGGQDYNSAIRDALKGLYDKGIVSIDYGFKKHFTVEAAVRQNIMGGLGLMQEKISQQNHDDLGCDGWEISAHSACAEDHAPFQGRQYTDKEYKALNNSLVRRISQLNCAHSAFPIILGISEPQYTPEELEQMRKDNETGVTYEGKHYTLYEATQRQRQLERAIRSQKRKILIDKTVGDDERLQNDQIKLVRLRDEYARFSKAAGLPTQHARAEAAGFTWKEGKEAETAYKQASAVNENFDRSFYLDAPVELSELSNYIDEKLYNYSQKESKWSKVTHVVAVEQLPGTSGRKEWSCDITLRQDAGIKTVIHEHLHARSVSYYDRDTFIRHRGLEEGPVELFAQEICKVNQISYQVSYKEYTQSLKIINSITKYGEDFKFAKDLFDIPLPDRYNWLRMQVEYAIQNRRISDKTKEALWAALGRLKGGV